MTAWKQKPEDNWNFNEVSTHLEEHTHHAIQLVCLEKLIRTEAAKRIGIGIGIGINPMTFTKQLKKGFEQMN